MLIKGINSYLTLEEANKLIKEHFSTAYNAYWENLSDGQKEVELITSCNKIDSLPLLGFKSNYNQTMQFPRVNSRRQISNEHFSISDELEYDDLLKLSVVDNVVHFFDIEENSRIQNIRKGLKSYELENFKEEYFEGNANSLNECSSNVYTYLSQWLRGAFTVC